jgi:general secretion pathway protein J
VSRARFAHRVQGFTLIEVLLAIALLGLLSAMAYSGLDATLRTQQGSERVVARVAELQRAMSIIQRDLEQIVERGMRNDAGTLEPAVVGGGVGSSLITLTKTGWRMPQPPPRNYVRSELQRVSYQLEDSAVLRLHQFHLDPVNETSSKAPLLNNVEKLSFEFLDNQNQWQTSWPMASYDANGQPSADTPPPKAIKLKLTLKDLGEFERLFLMGIKVNEADLEPQQQQQQQQPGEG